MKITYAILTHPPLVIKDASTSMLPFDLHVLGLPLSFILSQYQTINREIIKNIYEKKFMLKKSQEKIASLSLVFNEIVSIKRKIQSAVNFNTSMNNQNH